ncbi:MAG: relaxase/mobilization nuclease domain-containing protein [Oscillospiraceae bacterium]
MAITTIHAVKATPELALNYIQKDKIEITKDGSRKVFKTLSSAQNCSLQNANKEMQIVRQKFDKDNNNLLYHVIQNFGEKVDTQIANEIGRKLASELFSKYQCVISTHTNTDYTHTHIVFNSVSFIDGQKYNDCLKTYAQIRKVSDKICKEYELEILEKTKDLKLIKYKDDNGKIKFFEPTERKTKIREKQFANANDYRDTKAFAEKEIFKKSNVQIIKEDIDRLLPYCTSYENLLKSLEEIGYKIKSKTINGEWLKHISFQGSTQQKATRDSTIGEEYTREFLTQKINEQQIEIAQNNGELPELSLDEKPSEEKSSEKEIYKLGRIDIENLDENIRYNFDLKQETKRSPAEKCVVLNTKYLHYEYKVSLNFEIVPSKSKQLENSINKNLSALYFMEQNNIQSFKQINDFRKILAEKQTAAAGSISEVSNLLKSMNEKVSLINVYNSLKEQVKNPEKGYIQIEQEIDLKALQKCENQLKKWGLFDEEKQLDFKKKVENNNAKLVKMIDELARVNSRISEYDTLVSTISEIDKNISKSAFKRDIENYHDIGKDEKNESKNLNRNKGYER